MSGSTRTLGILRPLGGGDSIELKKDEMVVGRRPTNDIRVDFENVSGKHCVLRLVKGVWHVRDLGSTNGTTLNGQAIAHETSIMPDDELGIAGHYYAIDYDPIAPSSLIDANQLLEEEIAAEPRRQHSLMELAGLESEETRSRWKRPERAPDRIARPSAKDAEFGDALPRQQAGKGSAEPDAAPFSGSDDDFLKLIQEDIPDDNSNRRKGGR